MSDLRAGVVRSKPLVRYVVAHTRETLQPSDALGIVTVHGYDLPAAQLMASKRFRMSQDQLTLLPWEDAPPDVRVMAALREKDAASEQLVEALR